MQVARVKRHKVNVACDPCRSRKTKCDGRRPVCQPCQKKASTGLKCTWQPFSGRLSSQQPTQPAPQANVRPALQASRPEQTDFRIQRAVDVIGLSPSYSSSLNPYPPTHRHSSHSPTRQDPDPRDAGTQVLAGVPQYQSSEQIPYYVSPSERSVNAIIGATLEEDIGAGFFGSSSAGTFMQSVKRLVQQKVGSLQQEHSSSDEFPQAQRHLDSGYSTALKRPFDYVLPSRRRADGLMLAYWKNVHVLYPYLDKFQVENDYEKIWKGDDGLIPDEKPFMALLNAIFALSSQIDESTPVEEREQQSHAFYTRARSLLDIVDCGSVRSVQSFLILGQYFQSTNAPHPCWVFVGIGIRTAQSLGLHLPETSERIKDLRTRELLRRVWHGCIMMDRIVCMTYGRPCMIGPRAAATVPLPLPVEEADINSNPSQEPTEHISSCAAEFYVLSLKLYAILHDVLFNFYSVNFQRNRPLDAEKYFGSLSDGHASFLEIEHRLSKWQDSIPGRLRFTSVTQSNAVEPPFYRQAVILHQRQLHVRILLLRPILSSFLASEFHDGNRSPPLASSLSQRISLQCAIFCVNVALDMIETIYRERGPNAGATGNLAAWWYNVLYLYTSATVLIAARLNPSILADVSEGTVLEGWNKAMEVLDWYSHFGASIKRLTITLRLLFEAVPQQYSRYNENFRQGGADSSAVVRNSGQGSAPFAFWRLPEPANSFSTAVNNQQGTQSRDDVDALANDALLSFDIEFDPSDLSWLMNIPLDS